MKKRGYFLMAVLAVSLTGCGDPCKENIGTKFGDTVATLGKSGVEKDKALIERAANRAGKCAEKTGNDMKKSMGL